MNRSIPSSDAAMEAARRESEVLGRLQKGLRNKRLAIIVGAGVTLSATAHGSGKPLSRIVWTGLIQNGLDFLVSEGYVDQSNSQTKRAYEALHNFDINSLLDAADTLSSHLREHGQFPTWLQSVFGSLHREVRHPAILEALKNLHEKGVILLTTNYDDVLETYCGLKHIGRSKIEDIVKFRRGDLDGVFHVHGSYHDPQEVVLDTTNYYQIRESDEVQNMLKAFLDDKTLLFVGCGSGLEDPNFDGLLKWAAERQKSIPNSHCLLVRDGDSLVCKPLWRVKYGPNYHDLAPYLQKILDDPQDLTLRFSRLSVFSVPFERDKQFVGRDGILSRIEEQLPVAYRVSLYGLGGIGKSQIAIEYAYRYRDAYPEAHVFWVYAANAARFDQSYKNIARKLKLPRVDDPNVDICELVSDWLNDDDNDGEWLMILDNADNPDLFFSLIGVNPASEPSVTKKPLADYLPKKLTSKHSLLITTRNQQLGGDLSHGEQCIEVLPFSLREAAVLLRSKAGKTSDSWNDSDAGQLAEMLGRIPLGLTQAATFIKRNRMSPRRYRESLEANEGNVKDFLGIEHLDHRRERGISNAVFRTWELSFNQVREQEPQASAMLSLMVMFDRQQIPELLIRQHGSDAEFFRAIGTLQSLSMVMKEAGKETYAIHRLVQLSVRVWLEGHSQKADYQEKALSQLADRFPNGKHENRALCEMLLPHARAVLRYKFDSESSQLRLADILYRISWFDWQQGRYGQAYASGLEAHQVMDKLLGQDNIQTIQKLSMVALVLRYQGKYEEAEQMNRRALKGYEKALGREHPDTLTSVSNLASVLQYQGKYEEAEQINRRALEGHEKALGKEHPDTLTSVNDLASVLQYQGKYEKAEQMNRRALEGYEKVLGKEHPYTLTSVSNLASVLRYQGKYEMAEQMNRRALKGREKALGKEHPDTLTSVGNLASVLRHQGKYQEAEQMNRQTLKGREKALGKEHPDTLTSVSNLASVLQYQRKYEEAEQINRRALEGREKVLGKEHPDTLMSVGNLASVLQYQEKYEEAEQMNRRALKGHEKALGKEHPDTLTSVGNLASVLQYLGKYEEAEQMKRRALEGYEKVLGKEHPDTLASVYNLAYLYHQRKRYDTAPQLYQRVCDAYKRILGPQHPTTVACCIHFSEMVSEIDHL